MLIQAQQESQPGKPAARRVFPGTEVLVEIGFSYLAINRDCDFWTYSWSGPEGRSGGVVHQGRLDPSQVEKVNEILRLDLWNELGPVHGLCCVFDFTPSSYHWGSRTTTWIGTPASMGPPPVPDVFPSDPPTLVSEVRDLLSGEGMPASGPVRYTVFSVDELRDATFELAPSWPLEPPLSEFALTDNEISLLSSSGGRPPVYRAEGEDAEKLRAIRNADRNGEFGTALPGTIPIQEPDGARYYLFVRDVASFESPEGVAEFDPLSL